MHFKHLDLTLIIMRLNCIIIRVFMDSMCKQTNNENAFKYTTDTSRGDVRFSHTLTGEVVAFPACVFL